MYQGYRQADICVANVYAHHMVFETPQRPLMSKCDFFFYGEIFGCFSSGKPVTTEISIYRAREIRTLIDVSAHLGLGNVFLRLLAWDFWYTARMCVRACVCVCERAYVRVHVCVLGVGGGGIFTRRTRHSAYHPQKDPQKDQTPSLSSSEGTDTEPVILKRTRH